MNRKKWIITGSILLLVIVAAIIAYLIFFLPPSRQDFTSAKAEAEKIKDYQGTALLTDYNRAVVAASKEGKTLQQMYDVTTGSKKKLIDALDARATHARKVAESRVQRDAETKKTFDTYQARETRYQKYLRGYADSFPVYMSSFATCQPVFGITKQTTDALKYAELHKKAAGPCVKDLDTLAKSSVTPFADYAKEFRRIVDGRQKAFDGIANKTLDYSGASVTIKQLGNDFSKNDPTDKLQEFGKNALFNGELNTLIATLDRKANAAK